MDLEPPEWSRSRAVSSEPCSTRPNPFDQDEQSARKRQRVSSGGSRSRSADAARGRKIRQLSATPEEGNEQGSGDPQPPQTPQRPISMKPSTEPTSSRVTINLRSTKHIELNSSETTSPATPTNMVGQPAGSKVSLEENNEAVSDKQPNTTPPSSSSSSPSASRDSGEPNVELIAIDDEFEAGQEQLPIAIIDNDDEDEDDDDVYDQRMPAFPFNRREEPLAITARKIARYLEYDPVEDEGTFCKLRDWIDVYLEISKHHESSWYDAYHSNREFWDMIPNIVWALSRRRNFFGSFMQKSREGRRALTEFLCQFARLAGRFVAMDLPTVVSTHESGEAIPELGSNAYLKAFGWLLRKEETGHIGRNLEAHYRWNWNDDITMMMSSFMAGGGSVTNLTRYVDGILALTAQKPTLIECLTEPSRIVDRAVSDAAQILSEPERSHKRHIESCEQVMTQGYLFFEVMSQGLPVIIEKHVTLLTPEAALTHFIGLSHILHCCLLYNCPPALDLLEDHQSKHPSLSQDWAPLVISSEWKFSILRKLIFSSQMQLRVIGVTQMCGDLLGLYKEFKRDDPAAQPILVHFANFVLDLKVLDYIVGKGAHTEIINESHNIAGFLVATKTYPTELTDTIWQTVTTSQDSRVVEAILKMLVQILNLHDYEALLYLCGRASQLPLESFTAAMREYCESLLKSLVLKASAEKIPAIDAPPYQLCVRLIRESSILSATLPNGHLDLQRFAVTRLRELIPHGPESTVRNSIYVSCIEDISKRTATSAGSICALLQVLKANFATDLHILTTEHGLTALMIEELEVTNSGEQAAFLNPASNARRELLLQIINHEPSTITPELGVRLWTALVGPGARNTEVRNGGWQILNSAAKRNPCNKFVVTCFKEYLPTLNPEFFTLGSLDFARASIFASISNSANSVVDQEHASDISCVEQLWRMVLNAPPCSIEAPAINVLVELYIDSPMISNMPRTRAHNVHLALVNRCLDQLSTAATKLTAFSDGSLSGEEDAMVVVVSSEQVQEQEMMFTRSLNILREFLRAYQSKPHYMLAPPRSPVVKLVNEPVGELFTIKYQVFDGESISGVKELTIGKQNTVASLFAKVQKVTGFKGCKIYHWGKEIDLDETDVLAVLEDLKIGHGLLLVKRSSDEDSIEGHLKSRASTIELEIMKHIDNLWKYLGMEEKLAREIYYFLTKFPIHTKLLELFDSETASCEDMFPFGMPFKCLYTVHALREHVATQSQKGSLNGKALSKFIGHIVCAITTPAILDSCSGGELRTFLAWHLTEAVAQFLREPLPVDSLPARLDAILLNRLVELLYEAKAELSMVRSAQLVVSSFEAMLEASFHSSQFWTAFSTHPQMPRLLQGLLLEDPRPALRKHVMKQLHQKCVHTHSLCSLSATDFAFTIWPILESFVPLAAQQPQNCEEALTLTLAVFRKLADTSIQSVDIEACLHRWGTLLVEHKSHEEVGHPDSVDTVSQGLARLLYWCASFAKASQRPLPPNRLAIQILRKHLFPDFTTTDDETAITENLPLFNSTTRKLMCDIIIYLTRDDREQYQAIVDYLAGLVPYDPNGDQPYVYELPTGFERSKAIRSQTGYVGLRNLSNTCYLNSLFTQLYMNPSFRAFMLKAHVADGALSQKLLYETQKLFTYMQRSLKKFVDPTSLAASIRTYEDAQIDVSVQMDVDEFYNLLFDRWEGQILSPVDKLTFRAFYGGQLVQQVKSKECPHISERLEVFSAIQCDIKGKASLQESLQAYVDGEVMEGDNKYKCSTCDRHVNAVKRACLKDIPDNLIFHLKRFDFNLRLMTRSKINDYFSFPHRIDMRPYTVEHIMGEAGRETEDIYELVGILVHTGTAESGHYYSYIRERPSTMQPPTWLEFNDDTVLPVDATTIEASCFGGPDYRGPDGTGGYQFDKTYSAYMLFYQRASLLEQQQRDLHAISASQLTVPAPRGLSNYIAGENEMLLRKYCLYDEGHPQFVLRLLENARHINKGRCSEDHALEKDALFVTLCHFDQVVCRTKDLPDLQAYTLTLNEKIRTCVDCASNFLEWMVGNEEAFKLLLFRNPDQSVRFEVALAVFSALSKVKQEGNESQYGLSDESMDDDAESEYASPRIFLRLTEVLKRFWDHFHLNTKAWPEYFGLLVNIAQLGPQEAAILLDMKFLFRALEVISADRNLHIHPQYQRMLNIVEKRPLNKPVSYEHVIALAEVLLKACDLKAATIHEDTLRLDMLGEGAKLPLTDDEQSMLVQHWTRGHVNIFCEKLLFINQNEKSTQEIIRMMVTRGSSVESVLNAIRAGIRKTAHVGPVTPYLKAALTLIANTDSRKYIEHLVQYTSTVARQLDGADGLDFLRFFKELMDVPTHNAGISKEYFINYVIEQIPEWAPSLLTYYDSTVRAETEGYVQQALIRTALEESLDVSDGQEQSVVLQTARRLGVNCLKYLHDEHVRPRVQIVRAALYNIQAVIDQCRRLYDQQSEDELDREFYSLHQLVMGSLRRLTVEVADDEVSEWDNSDDALSSSEVMESVTELGGGVADFNDDTQL